MNVIVERLGWTLVHSVWQLLVVATVAALVDRELRQQPIGDRRRITPTREPEQSDSDAASPHKGDGAGPKPIAGCPSALRHFHQRRSMTR